MEQTDQACAGVVIRDAHGAVRLSLSSWRVLFHCSSAEDAEFSAYREGTILAAQCVPWSVILETDCASCMSILAQLGTVRSQFAALIRNC